MKENLFSYGTLQKREIQLKLFGRFLSGAKDNLRGWKISSIKITDKAFLAKGEEKSQLTVIFSNDETDAVEGTAFELSIEELLKADRYEPENYQRIRVELESGKKAWVYAAR